MSTLVDFQIADWAGKGGLTPYSTELINPASVNLRLGKTALFEGADGRLYPKDLSRYSKEHPLMVAPGAWFLAETAEVITLPDNLEGEICLRSSAARAGFQHALAGYIDPGWTGVITLEFKNLRRSKHLPIYPGIELVQLRLTQLRRRPRKSYAATGRYQGDTRVRACADSTISIER